MKAPVTLVVTFADITEVSAVQWYECCGDICSVKMESLHELFGGFGRIAEIDRRYSVKKTG